MYKVFLPGGTEKLLGIFFEAIVVVGRVLFQKQFGTFDHKTSGGEIQGIVLVGVIVPLEPSNAVVAAIEAKYILRRYQAEESDMISCVLFHLNQAFCWLGEEGVGKAAFF